LTVAREALSSAVRVFTAGASGVMGRSLIPILVGRGNEVTGMTRSPAKTAQLCVLGAIPVVCEVFEVEALIK
jgi:putative NADH-flavin reductase